VRMAVDHELDVLGSEPEFADSYASGNFHVPSRISLRGRYSRTV
jgi:hypothetical protein